MPNAALVVTLLPHPNPNTSKTLHLLHSLVPFNFTLNITLELLTSA